MHPYSIKRNVTTRAEAQTQKIACSISPALSGLMLIGWMMEVTVTVPWLGAGKNLAVFRIGEVDKDGSGG